MKIVEVQKLGLVIVALVAFSATAVFADDGSGSGGDSNTKQKRLAQENEHYDRTTHSLSATGGSYVYNIGGQSSASTGALVNYSLNNQFKELWRHAPLESSINVSAGSIGGKLVGSLAVDNFLGYLGRSRIAYGYEGFKADYTPTAFRVMPVAPALRIYNDGKLIKGKTTFVAGLGLGASTIPPKDSKGASGGGLMFTASTEQDIADLLKIKARVDGLLLREHSDLSIRGAAHVKVGNMYVGPEAVWTREKNNYQFRDRPEQAETIESMGVMLTAGGAF